MRFALVSDVHANWQAWNAALLDIRSSGVDSILCLGDVVGYGPQPAHVLESVHANVDHIVLGNHDAALIGKLDLDLFNDSARAMIEWTRGQLGPNAVKFLGQLPLSIDAGDFRCTHGDFSRPAAFNYILDVQDALASWQAVTHPLLFCGHTHEPAVFLLEADRSMRRASAGDFTLPPQTRALINVGSVGQPRDGEARAGYVIYDTDRAAIQWRRIPFDLDAYRAAVRRAGIPEEASPFLALDPRADKAPVRAHMNFSPATSPGQSVQNTVEVQEVRALRRQARKWKRLTAAALLATLAGAGVGGTAWWRHARRAEILAAPPAAAWSRQIAQAPRATNLLPPLRPAAPGQAIPGWSLQLGDRRRQQIHVVEPAPGEETDGGLRLRMISETARDPVGVSFPEIPVQEEDRLQAFGLFRTDPGFAGNVVMVVALVREIEGATQIVDPFLTFQPALRRRHNWMAAQRTFDVLAGTRAVQLHIRGEFTGQVDCRDIELRLR